MSQAVPRAWLVSCLLVPCWISACDDASPTTSAAGGRVVAVAVRDNADADIAGFCDRYVPDGEGTKLTLPTAVSPPDALAPGKPRWLNVWATWCKPCVEELPRLVAWQRRLSGEGQPMDLTFLSVDASVDAVDTFRREHSDAPQSLHVADPESFSTWQRAMGIDEGSPIPLHLYADGQGVVRCVRAGAVAEKDFAIVQALVARHR